MIRVALLCRSISKAIMASSRHWSTTFTTIKTSLARHRTSRVPAAPCSSTTSTISTESPLTSMLQAPRSSLVDAAYSVKDVCTGQGWVSDIGLYDDRNRFMSPDLGRFLQPDPIGFKGDATNLYRYCGNDWANRSDPMGLEYVAAGGARATELQNKEGTSRMKDDRGALAEYAMLNLQRINFRDAGKDMAGFKMGTSSQTRKGQFDKRG